MKDKTTGAAYNLQFLTEVMKTEYNKVTLQVSQHELQQPACSQRFLVGVP